MVRAISIQQSAKYGFWFQGRLVFEHIGEEGACNFVCVMIL